MGERKVIPPEWQEAYDDKGWRYLNYLAAADGVIDFYPTLCNTLNMEWGEFQAMRDGFRALGFVRRTMVNHPSLGAKAVEQLTPRGIELWQEWSKKYERVPYGYQRKPADRRG